MREVGKKGIEGGVRKGEEGINKWGYSREEGEMREGRSSDKRGRKTSKR